MPDLKLLQGSPLLTAPDGPCPVAVGDRFQFAGTRAQLDGLTIVEVTDISLTGMVGLRVESVSSPFPQYTSVPLERTVLLVSFGVWVPAGPAAG